MIVIFTIIFLQFFVKYCQNTRIVVYLIHIIYMCLKVIKKEELKMIIKIIIGVLCYIALLVLFCIFLKGATKLGNEYDEQMEALKRIEELKNK